MGNEFISYFFLLLLLLLMQHAPGNASDSGEIEESAANVIADGVNVLRLPSSDVSGDIKHGHGHSSSHVNMGMGMGHDAPVDAKIFFLLKDLKVGKTMPIYFPHIDPSKSFNFLPKQQADSIPLSSNALPYLLRFFSFSQDSPQAEAMKMTLDKCESEPFEGEIPYCATSLESLFDFGRSIFGSDSGIQILSTSQTSKSTPVFQNYTVLEIKEMTSPKMIGCHNMPYPYAVYYCHNQRGDTRVFKVSLEGENGDRVNAAAACHFDTSHWFLSNISFDLLGVSPGESEVCHFFPADDLVLLSVTPTL